MRVKPRVQAVAPLVEFLAGAGLGILFHLVLHDREAAFAVFGIGLLLSLATYLLREEMTTTREILSEEYRKSHEIALALSRIHDPECQEKGQELLAGLMKNYALLQQGHIPLDETELLVEAAKGMEQARERVLAVNHMIPSWGSRMALSRYYESNRRAVRRGVDVCRIFVVSREQLVEEEVQRLLKSHLTDGMDVRVVFRESISPRAESGWAGDCSFNFVIIDDRVVIDVFKNPGTYYGTKTKHNGEITRYLRLFELIEHNAHQAVMDGEEVAVAP